MTIANFDVRTRGNIVQKDWWIGVDLMMLCYAIISTKPCWRQQTQVPPVPQRSAWEFLTTWYNRHKFKSNNQTLVFTCDSRRTSFKEVRAAARKLRLTRARKAVENAKSLKEIENKKALPGK